MRQARKPPPVGDCNLVVRLPPGMRGKVKEAAILSDQTIQAYVAAAIAEALARVETP